MEVLNLSVIVFFLVVASATETRGKLSVDYYAKTCPNLESLVQGAVQGMMASSPIVPAATLRLFFHDCFVTVCSPSSVLFLCFSSNDKCLIFLAMITIGAAFQ